MSVASPGQLLGEASVGNDAGWALAFHTETAGEISPVPTLLIRREDYYAEIQATLPGDFSGGSYTFVVEGLIDEHYGAIAQDGSASPSVVRLYLYWRDASSIGGYLASVAGLSDLLGPLTVAALEPALVAELAILSVSRRTGTRMYETQIVAQERAFKRARSTRLAKAVDEATVDAAVTKLADDLGVPCEVTPAVALAAPPPGEAARVAIEVGTSYRQALASLAERAELTTGKAGRGMALIRKGKLHFGPRAIPLEGETKELTALGGLVEVSRTGGETRDPNADLSAPSLSPAARAGYTITLKGRPDIRPGDLVSLHVAREDGSTTLAASLLGAVVAPFTAPLGALDEGEPKVVYVNSVEHKLGRTSGFVTTVAGVEIANAADAWDTPSKGASQPAADGSTSRGPGASGAAEAAQAIKRLAQETQGAARLPEAAEVRAAAKDDSVAERPRQTERVWRGLEPSDGAANQAARLGIERERPSPVDGVPYASPFAWGKCGLVLPRYPGTRVMLMHRNGLAEDPVDVGALWEARTGPDNAEPGDWWLILPVGVQSRASVADGVTPTAHTGQVTHDLVDGDGNRVIETGTLTIRVGAQGLRNTGERPPSVTADKEDSMAHITIDDTGAVTIHSTGDLVLKAPNGDIKLDTQNVDVKVTGAMDVHT